MQLSLMNSTVSFGPHAFNKPHIQSSLFPKKNQFLHGFVPPKKLVLTVSNKKQKPLIVKSSMKDLVKLSSVLTNQIFQSLASFDRWVIQSLSNLIAFKSGGLFKHGDLPLFEEGDLIQYKHDGNCIVGVVQHMGFLETTLVGPVGLIILHNFKIDIYSITNFTRIKGNEKLFGFHTVLDCKNNRNLSTKEIVSVLEKDENVKDNIADNLVVPTRQDCDKIQVSCYVNCSRLQIPQYRSYLQFGRQVLTALDSFIYRNKVVADYPNFEESAEIKSR